MFNELKFYAQLSSSCALKTFDNIGEADVHGSSSHMRNIPFSLMTAHLFLSQRLMARKKDKTDYKHQFYFSIPLSKSET